MLGICEQAASQALVLLYARLPQFAIVTAQKRAHSVELARAGGFMAVAKILRNSSKTPMLMAMAKCLSTLAAEQVGVIGAVSATRWLWGRFACRG